MSTPPVSACSVQASIFLAPPSHPHFISTFLLLKPSCFFPYLGFSLKEVFLGRFLMQLVLKPLLRTFHFHPKHSHLLLLYECM
ncbi:hypothetical protein B0H12DRAFT_1102719 [Mycena haematopus]|nr:hypothetical protein B0H12DRAFT_1102719 [Mycena haematopus]